jgi:hypothetical protein
LTKKNISPANIHFLTNSQFFEKSLNLDMIGLLTDNFFNKKVIDDHLSAHELQTHESCKINKIFLWCSKYKLPFLLIDIHFLITKSGSVLLSPASILKTYEVIVSLSISPFIVHFNSQPQPSKSKSLAS